METLTKFQKEALALTKLIVSVPFPKNITIVKNWTTRNCKITFTGYKINITEEVFEHIVYNAQCIEYDTADYNYYNLKLEELVRVLNDICIIKEEHA